MFSFLSKEDQITIRLPKVEREVFLERCKTNLTFTFNNVMKEYVTVPDELTGNATELKPYMVMSLAYTSGLKPKATKRKKI